MINQEITTVEALDESIKVNRGILFVNFYSPHCGPCMMLKPVLEQLVNQNQINLIKVNVLALPEIADTFNVNQWPTNFIYCEQKLVTSVVGYQDLATWQSQLENIKSSS